MFKKKKLADVPVPMDEDKEVKEEDKKEEETVKEVDEIVAPEKPKEEAPKEEPKVEDVNYSVRQVATETGFQVFDGADKPVSDLELLVRVYNDLQLLKKVLL